MAKILVVDDDVITLQIVSSLLHKEGHAVQTATDALTALDYLDQEGFNLLITDANMPKISGYNLVTTLRKSLKHRNLPIIFMTARRSKPDVMRALDSGVDDYVIKPIEVAILSEKIKSLLEAKGTSAEHEKVELSAPAVFLLNLQVCEVNPLGLLLDSADSLPLDYKFKIASDIFSEINIKAPLLRVVGCAQNKNEHGRILIRTHFIGLSDEDKKALNAWIKTQKAA
ncbi:hypothetical protein AZI86_04090 [Bdellovibrio bacteriovorus]|uniref:Response regulatory domain-containing protein n=1 Tax=Bdellovibrio bacteriovorus TaxID=959 RepID=A0A150WPL8_BDEBC|nr:response regulator [Bdellovibrio bacteriovorus]KYG66247.1 hypothetical protein AZI86_04090 [Bdellovibrio bacteriovorus]